MTSVRKMLKLYFDNKCENVFCFRISTCTHKFQLTYQSWNKRVLSEESLDTRLTAKCIPSEIDVVTCLLHNGSEIVIIVSSIDSA